MPHDVFVISSGDSDDSLPTLTFSSPGKLARTPPKKTAAARQILSSDDDEDILPLFERIARKTVNPPTGDVLPAVNPLKLSACPDQALGAVSSCQGPPSAGLEQARTTAGRGKRLDLSSGEEDLPGLNDCILEQKLGSSSTDSDGREEIVEAPKAKPNRKLVSKSGKSDTDVVARREEARRQREEKAAVIQREKMLKQIQAQQQRCMKPGECIKFVKAIMDFTLLEMPEAEEIPKLFADSGVQYTLNEQAVPRSITWVRQVDRSAVNCNNKVDRVSSDEEENQAVVLMPVKEFLAAVHRFKQVQIGEGKGCTLHDIVYRLKMLLHGKAVTILICGIQKYFQQQRSKQQRAYRTNVLDDVPGTMQGKPKRARKREESDVNVSRVDVEEALVDLQIREPCNVRLVDTPAEVAQVIASFTKAIAEAPYKQSKEDGGTFSWLASGDTGQAVKVDKSGAGLLLLWQRQIEQFHLVSADVAQAIVAEYSSPTALLKAYSQCSSLKERERLLQDIMVRRGAGPLARTRRIGPELSRKLHILLTSTDGSQVLDGS